MYICPCVLCNSVNYLVHLETFQVLTIMFKSLLTSDGPVWIFHNNVKGSIGNHNIECLSVSWCSSPCVIYQQLYCILRWINFHHSLHHILCITFWNDNVVIMIICSTLYCMIKSIHVHPTSDIMSDDNEMVRRVNFVICFWSLIWHCV